MKIAVATAVTVIALLSGSHFSHSATTTDPPHDSGNGYICATCHTPHKTLGTTGYDNICLNCHNHSDPKGNAKPFALRDMANPFNSITSSSLSPFQQNSHNWMAADTNLKAGALPPIQAAMTTNALRDRTNGKLACVRCHDPHSQAERPFLRAANDRDQMCLDCHRSRNQRDHRTGTHPVNFNYTGATSKAKTAPQDYFPQPLNANPDNPTSNLPLKGGTVLCSTCHGVHHADSSSATYDSFTSLGSQVASDGSLLRTDLHGIRPTDVNICSACHAGKLPHNGRGQNVQCTDCHGAHVDAADGTQANVWLVNRQMNYSSLVRSAKNTPVYFQSETSKNYRDNSGNGVCQVCHDIPQGSGYQTFHGGTDSSNCNLCHTHGNNTGSFSADANLACTSCHGYPPTANVSGIGGYAPGYQNAPSFSDESLTGHTSHAVSPYQKACENCHQGNNHLQGNYQDVFLDTNGIVAATGGLNPHYNGGTQRCDNVYCHSNANPRGGVMINRTTPAWSSEKGGGKGSIIGTADECSNCHSMAGSTNPTWSKSHTMHVATYNANANFTCNTCHAATASANNVLFNTTAARSLHTNGTKNVVFNSFAEGNWSSTSAGCSNVYCHSNVQGVNGTGIPTTFTENLAWNGSAMTCSSCHPSMVKHDNISTASGSHKRHVQIYPYGCANCHGSGYSSNSINTSTHVDKQITMSLISTATHGGVTASYYQGSNSPGGGYGTCSNVYCHSSVQSNNGTGNPQTYGVPLWGGAPIQCGSCHVNMTTSAAASGSHIPHLQREQYKCNYCHSGAGKSPDPPFTATAKHANGKIEIAFADAANGTVYSKGSSIVPGSAAYGTCNGNCHGAMLPTWGNNTAKARCSKCHGYRAAGWNALSGATATTDPRAGAHFNHISSAGAVKYTKPLGCAECHASSIALASDNVNAAGHFDSAAPAELSFGALAKSAGALPSYNSPTAGQCSNVYCHGSTLDKPATAVLSPTWSQTFLTGIAANDCNKCHGYPPATSIHSGKLPTDCNGCHGHLNATGTGFINPALHINGTVEASSGHSFPYPGTSHRSAANPAAPFTNCDGCHDTTTPGGAYPVPSGTAPNCSACHLKTANFTGATPGCWDCHGSSATNGLPSGNAFPNISGSHSKHVIGQSMACAACHDSRGGGLGDLSHGNNNRVAHNNSFVNVTSTTGQFHFSFTGGTGKGTCTNIACHGTAEWGVTKFNCLTCHSAAIGSRSAVTGQFASQSHHVQGAELPLTAAHCAKCHWEAKSDGSVDPAYHSGTSGKGVSLVVWNGTARPVTATMGTTYISYTANGSRSQIEKLNQHCLSCHNTANQVVVPFGKYSTHRYSPEARLAAPRAKTSIQSRYSSTATVAWSQYRYSSATGNTSRFGTNSKNRITKALSAHGNAANNQMMNWNNVHGEDIPSPSGADRDYTYSGTSGKRNVFCYDCHNAHGSDASGITSSYSSATGRYKGGLLKSTVAGQGGYSVTYKPAARTVNYRNYSTVATTAAIFNAGASICNDCHNDDTRKINISRPWSITGTFSSSKAIVGYWSTPYFDNYTMSSTKRTAYKAGSSTIGSIKDMRKPMGGHYGSSINGVQAGHTGEINGLCTPCHDPHGVSRSMSVVDAGKSVPLLKGTWVTSPYREDKADKIIKRGGGSNYTGMNNIAAVPGYHIDQNTFMVVPLPNAGGASSTSSKSNQRRQAFRNISNSAIKFHDEKTPATFAGLCLECHNQSTLTGAASATTTQAWMSKERVHQSVAGWGPTNGTNIGNKIHAYTCSKCHAPHVSRLPRLMVTDCLDVRHTGQRVSGGSVNTASGTAAANYGNVLQSYASSAYGAGRFPGGGSRYSGTPGSAQNPGPWWFQTNGANGTTQPTVPTYGSNCHNAADAGGTTYNPSNQMWNRKTRW